MVLGVINRMAGKPYGWSVVLAYRESNDEPVLFQSEAAIDRAIASIFRGAYTAHKGRFRFVPKL